MAVPTIDGIDFNTFRIRPVYGHGQHYRGIFEWGFLYKESEVPEKELQRRDHFSEPYRYVDFSIGLTVQTSECGINIQLHHTRVHARISLFF